MLCCVLTAGAFQIVRTKFEDKKNQQLDSVMLHRHKIFTVLILAFVRIEEDQ